VKNIIMWITELNKNKKRILYATIFLIMLNIVIIVLSIIIFFRVLELT